MIYAIQTTRRLYLVTLLATFGMAGCGDSLENQFIERIREESALRSAEENSSAAMHLLEPLNEALEAGDAGRAKDLSLEMYIILETLAGGSDDGSKHAQRLEQVLERIREESAPRPAGENFLAAKGFVLLLRELFGSEDLGGAKFVAREIGKLMEAAENMASGE